MHPEQLSMLKRRYGMRSSDFRMGYGWVVPLGKESIGARDWKQK